MIFLNSASSAAALVFYLPGVCTHTDTEGIQRKARVRNILKYQEKNTTFNEHPVYEYMEYVYKESTQLYATHIPLLSKKCTHTLR